MDDTFLFIYKHIFCIYFSSSNKFKKFKEFFYIIYVFFILSPFIYSVVSLSQDDKRTDYQGKKIAENIQNEWLKDHDVSINVVLGNEWEAGNLSYHLQNRPIWGGFISEKKLNSLIKFTCIDNVCVGRK